MFDTNKNLSHKSWINGGTHITNFSSNELMRYGKSIEIYEKNNPNHGLVISAFAYKADNKTHIEWCCSLHNTDKNRDLGLDDFWKIYDSLKDKVE